LLVVLLWGLGISSAFAAQADADSTGTPSGGALLGLLQSLATSDSTGALPDSLMAEDLGDRPFITSWTRNPSAMMQSGIRSSRQGMGFDNNLSFRDGSSMNQSFDMSREQYRSQDKVVGKRDNSLSYRNSSKSSLQAGLSLMQNWSEDEMTTSSGLTTLNKRDFRKFNATVSRDSLHFGGATHTIAVAAGVENQQGEQQNQRNNFSESDLSGGLGSTWEPASWMKVGTRVFAMTESGERSLGKETNPSATSGDSLRFGVSYDRGKLGGGFSVRQSNFDKRYLDYRRNSNGIIDTIGVVQKIVEELERNDAMTIEWSNELRVGPAFFKTRIAQDVTENAFRESGIGTKERQQDSIDIDLGLRLSSRDSLAVGYGSMKKWDDQTYQNATQARGRQVNHRRDVALNWMHRLFENTDLRLLMSTSLTQDIAENEFNKNDRDRLDSSMNLSLGTNWGDSGVKVDLSFDAHRVEDVSIRKERSGNNSIKDSYELTPSYLWPVASWLDLAQSFRVWIQYTDYVFSDLDLVNKQDDYNQRGNLDSKLTIRPNARLSIILDHNYNIKLNGKKTVTDAAGNDYYFRESDQIINKINAAISWKVTGWLTLDGTTYKSKDLKETFGNTTRETETFGGELGLGGKVVKKFGPGRTVTAGISKFFAHGPNVQQAGKEYWDADISVNWGF